MDIGKSVIPEVGVFLMESIEDLMYNYVRGNVCFTIRGTIWISLQQPVNVSIRDSIMDVVNIRIRL